MSTEYVVKVRKVRQKDGTELRGSELTYRYDSPLKVGDRVVCPSNDYSEAFIAEVTALGSDYQGFIRSLVCRVAPDRKRAPRAASP